MPTLDTIELIYQAFQEDPKRLKRSTESLSKQFGATHEQVKQARQLYRLNSKDYIIAQALLLEQEPIEGNTYYIPEKLLFKALTGNLPDYVVTGTGSPKLKEETISYDGYNQEDQWEVKQKWVKGKEGSQLLVRKEVDFDYKKEFREFLFEFKSINKPLRVRHDDGILFVYLADQHIGAHTKSTSLLDNPYNEELFGDRMFRLADEIYRIDQLYSLNKIVIVNLGDSVDGFNGQTTRGGHFLSQNMNNREIYNTFLNVHTNFFETLQKCDCKNFAYISVGESNHGGDFEWMCHKSLETVLNLKYPNIETHVGEKFVEHFTFGDHTFIFCHGKDMEDMKFGLPKNLNAKTEVWIKSYADQMGINSKYLHFIKGDLHLTNSEYSSFLRYKNCLSMYGASKWVQTNFMKNTKGVSMDILYRNAVTEHTFFL